MYLYFDSANCIDISRPLAYTYFGVVVAFIILFYALRSVGLFVLANKIKIANSKLAFVPFAWVYIACKLVGESKFFGKKFSKLALVICIFTVISGLINLICNIIIYYPLVAYYLQGGEVVLCLGQEKISGYVEYWSGGIYVDGLAYPYYNPEVIAKLLGYVMNINETISFVLGIVNVFIYAAIFRKFYPEHYFLATLLSVFGLFAPFIFAIRKKDAVDYNMYIKNRYNYGGHYGNPYGDDRNANNDCKRDAPDYPFKGFGERGDEKPEDPFAEFNNNNDNKDEK